jgi:ATP-dependent exoDNAse (exonuclease V) beta subunit
LEHPARLRVQTIDSLCVAIAAEMPWLARLGGMPKIEEDATELYREAARRTLLHVDDPHYGAGVVHLLRHLDNEAAHARDLIADMLARREQWIALAVQAGEKARQPLEEALRCLIAHRCAEADRLVPAHLREPWIALTRYSGREIKAWPGDGDAATWKKLFEIVLKKDGEWRQQFTAREGFPPENRMRKGEAQQLIAALAAVPGMREALAAVRDLPPREFTDSQWDATLALLDTLKFSLAHLRGVFREKGATDFVELGIAARKALEESGVGTDLAFRLDSRIQHLLVDEFQDTSRGQCKLIEHLISNWSPQDGRTLFLVGDPMQSIYRFRQAEVGIFLETRAGGIGPLRPKFLQLISNYRSQAAIVDRINQMFQGLFPAQEDAALGAVPFHASEARDAALDEGVTIHGFAADDAHGKEAEKAEAGRIVTLIREAQARAPEEKIAVLVRARTHLTSAVGALKEAGIAYQAVEIDQLNERAVVLDLLALTRAMLHRGDRIAWLAILRAPWCGLELADLEKLARRESSIWGNLQDVNALSADGQARAIRVRDTLAAAFREQGRWPLRRWVERSWTALGGPACLGGDEGAMADARAFFDHLEARQSSADLVDIGQFESGLEKLYAQPDPRASDRLQIMTIHAAKGLEFDMVIVAGLGRGEKVEDQQLVLFHEWGEAGEVERLIAPMPGPGDENPVYDYLRKMDRCKSSLERVRLFYVAATRAKKRLHLLGQAKVNKNGEASAPGGTMLGDLWEALTEEERARFKVDASEMGAAALTRTEAATLRRVPISWTPPALPMNLAPAATLREAHQPSFEWVGEALRIAGTVVHELLRRARGGRVEIPAPGVLRRLLMHEGVRTDEMAATAARISQALAQIQGSSKAQWILEDHREARSEYAIAGVDRGEIVRGKVDRTFIDGEGTRWIVDFKTSVHQGGELEEFLDDQQRRYRDQLECYARLLAPLGQPVRVGLYFPLLDEWREWDP